MSEERAGYHAGIDLSRETLGRRLRAARLAAGLSQSGLGMRLSPPRTHATISCLETGRTGLSIGLLCELAELLGVPVMEFIAPVVRCPTCGQRIEGAER